MVIRRAISLVLCLLCLPLGVKASQLTLSEGIRTDRGRFQHAKEIFLEANPGVDVAYTSAPSPVYDHEWTGISIDVIPTDSRVLQRYVAEGQIEPLWSNDENLNPWVQWASEETVYAVKMESFILYLKPDKDLLRTVGIQRPEKQWSWTEFFALSEQVASYNQIHGTDYALLCEDMGSGAPLWLLQYNSNAFSREGEKSYNSTSFRETLTAWKSMCDKGMSVTGDSARKALFRTVFTYPHRLVNKLDAKDLGYMPVYQSGIRPYLMMHLCWMIPKGAEQVDNARKFLRSLCNSEALERSDRCKESYYVPIESEWQEFEKEKTVDLNVHVPKYGAVWDYKDGKITVDACMQMLEQQVRAFFNE